jgi:GTPase SAR1 family protein
MTYPEQVSGPRTGLHPGITWRVGLPTPPALALSFAWSCDGRRLLMEGLDSTVFTAGDNEWNLTGRWEGIRSGQWSPTEPDVFACFRGNQIEMHRLSPSGGRAWTRRFMQAGLLHRKLAFSAAGARLVVADGSDTIRVISTKDGQPGLSLRLGHSADEVSWAPAGDRMVVRGSDGAYLASFDEPAGQQLVTGSHPILGAVWSRNGSMVCALSQRLSVVYVWDSAGRPLAELEGLTGGAGAVDFSADDRLLYAVDRTTLRCWRTDTWQPVAVIDVPMKRQTGWGIAASPGRSLLAVWGRADKGADLYEVDVDLLLRSGPRRAARTYRNAKVVLVGETGVGKSGLGLVLSNQAYRPTDSTHAREVLVFDEAEVGLPDGGIERRETLIWDMAGQSGYRLIHQLHLAEAAAALVVFDARSETDPFAGVRYWARALRQQSGAPALLVAARTDRGGIPAGDKRIAAVVQELGLTGYFETSAREGWHVAELAAAIRAAIDWDTLPLSVSTELFETIKEFLLGERDGRRVLATADDLFREFRRHRTGTPDNARLRESFDACVRLLESRDLVRRLSFGGFVLLRPELLDFYASSLIDEARAQPDGLGYLPERRALIGDFPMPRKERLPAGEESLLLIAVVEELLRHDLVLREATEAGVDLVFPSQLTADRPTGADPDAADVKLQFDGAIPAVYATLAVRLSRVSAYAPEEMWRNGSTYRAKVGGVCGVHVRQTQEGRGELAVFFDGDASEETRYLFEDYVFSHLTSRAVAGSVQRERIFTCPHCGYRVDAALVRRRLERGATDVLCTDCEEVRISLLDRKERVAQAATVRDMNASADAGRDAAANTATIHGKEATQDYDVFLSYNSADRAAVSAIAQRLRAAGLLPWIDQADFRAGDQWRDVLEEQIGRVRAAAVFLGPHGLGRWQRVEERALIDESTRRPLRIIPVLLPGLEPGAEPRGILAQWHAADFRVAGPEPFARLLGGIRGA